jgi:hypothetical protein
MVTCHGRCGLAASARRRTDHPGDAAARPFYPGDKHVLGQLLSFFLIDGAVDRKTMVPFLHQ